jgi:hypothetical protein
VAAEHLSFHSASAGMTGSQHQQLQVYGAEPINNNSSTCGIYFCDTPGYKSKTDDQVFPWTAILSAVSTILQNNFSNIINAFASVKATKGTLRI